MKNNLTLKEAKALAQKGIKMTHQYFTENEYMTMQGNIIIFEDNNQIFFDEWVEGKDYLLTGWRRFED